MRWRSGCESPWWRQCRSRSAAVLSASLVAFSRAVKSAAPESRSPFLRIASVCSFQTIVGPHFDLARLCQVRGKQAADRSATDYADLHRVIVLSSWVRVAGLLSGVKLPGNIGQALAFRFADAISVLRIEADLAVADRRPADEARRSCSPRVERRSSRRSRDTRAWSCQCCVRRDVPAQNRAWRTSRRPRDEHCWPARLRA